MSNGRERRPAQGREASMVADAGAAIAARRADANGG